MTACGWARTDMGHTYHAENHRTSHVHVNFKQFHGIRAAGPCALTGRGRALCNPRPMRADPLQRLSAAAKRLPGDVEKVALPRPAPLEGAARGGVSDATMLRPALAALLLELGARVEPALDAALTRASGIWDQMDAFTVLDGALRVVIEEHRLGWQALLESSSAASRAAATEALMTLDACVGLVALMERRLATLVRLRMRDQDTRLMVDGRPFLDVGAALKAAGRAWS